MLPERGRDLGHRPPPIARLREEKRVDRGHHTRRTLGAQGNRDEPDFLRNGEIPPQEIGIIARMTAIPDHVVGLRALRIRHGTPSRNTCEPMVS